MLEPAETEGERARRVGEVVDPPAPEMDALVGRDLRLKRPMKTWAADEDGPARDAHGEVPRVVKRYWFSIRARFGDRLLGTCGGLAYLLRPEWLEL